MSKLKQTVTFASQLYGQKATQAYLGYVRREPMALMGLRPGRVNPYALYERIRAEGDLVPTRLGNYTTTSHRLCDAVLRDRRFGATLDDAGAGENLFDLSFLEKNPPDHTRLRRLAQPAFSPRAVAGYEPRITEVVGSLLDKAAASGSFDLVADFAAPLPIAVITELLGVPDADTATFTRYGQVIASAISGITGLRHAAQLAAADAELRSLFQGLFELRRREPRDDLVSQLVAAEGDKLKPGELLPMCNLLLVAGFETTVNLIGNAVLALLGHPDQWRLLTADPAGMAEAAVEETLRWDPPVQATGRIALQSLELDGTPMARGQFVNTMIGGANRDPSVYERPAEFDLTRSDPAPHLAFSSGIHYCIGQPLARLEGTIALRELAARLPRLRVTGRVRRRNSVLIRGPRVLPVAV